MTDSASIFGRELATTSTPIPGLQVMALPVHGDNRGWFKENWQREKMVALGLPDFGPVQNNVSYNQKTGTTRGIHAEPWDKFISVVAGKIFGAWVDLRAGESFGAVYTVEVDAGTAVYVPRGVGNAFQTLEPNTVYSYLVNDHWSPEAQYTFLNLADPTAAIKWPIDLADAEFSDKDKKHPYLSDVMPMEPRSTVILGANGQLGRALQAAMPDAVALGHDDFDVAHPTTDFDWRGVGTVINAAAYTNVDGAESPSGREQAWQANVTGVAELVKIADRHNLTLVHVSSDYVFDGNTVTHTEDEPFSPLNVYGQTKAAGDAIVNTLYKHYIVRTSWVIGDGKNFVATMQSLAERGVDPSVVNDQTGRLSHTDNIAGAINHLLVSGAAYGTYNVSDDGPSVTWAEVAKATFAEAGADPERVTPVSTAEYYGSTSYAPRPRESTLDLAKIKATGYTPRVYGSSPA